MEQLLTTDELKLLVVGCPRHLPYRGTKEPKGDCAACADIHRMRQLLENVWATVPVEPSPFYYGRYDPNCLFCVGRAQHTPSEHIRSTTEGKRGTR